MASCEVTGDGLFLFEEGKQPECLIRFWDYYANLGALPLHTYSSDTERIMPRVLQELQGLCDELSCMLAVAAVFRQSLLGYRPLRVLLAGGGNTLLTVLEKAAKEAHPEGCVYALEGDGSFIRDCYFDLVVIGAEPSGEVMRNIIRATRAGGSVARVYAGRLEEKRVTEEEHLEFPGLKDEMRGMRAKLRRIVDDEPESLRAAVAVLSEMESLAIKLFDVADIDLKQSINEAKENALNALYTPDGVFRSAKLDKLRAFLNGKDDAP
jgi:SAM-dependent methyltransferase